MLINGHMSKHLLILAAIAWLLAGCIYEGVERQRVAIHTVSDRALAAFVRAQPSEALEHVETHTFKRKIVAYTVTFRRANGTTHSVDFARDGTIIPPRTLTSEVLK